MVACWYYHSIPDLILMARTQAPSSRRSSPTSRSPGWLLLAVGFAFAFGTGDIIGHDGFFLRDYGDPQAAFAIMGLSNALIESKWLFQFVFCAVSLAIVWGTTLERIKFHVYVIFALVFAGLIYPLASHWVFGGGWLQTNVGMQDFAGSTAVHLIGATGGLAALLLLGPRRGKYGPTASRARSRATTCRCSGSAS